jgi:hypothetical protein
MSQETSKRFCNRNSVVRSRPVVVGLVLALLTAIGVISVPHAGFGQAAKKTSPTDNLEGVWSGGGSVSFASGSREQARCRAHYRRASANSYTVNATCATPSGKAAQTATLRRVGEHRYSGSFYNSEYSISGVIHVFVSGARQTVRLVSDSGSAVFNLSR